MRFFFSSRRRHTRCALVTGVQTCALPIWVHVEEFVAALPRRFAHEFVPHALFAEQEPDLARKGAKRELIELPHAPGVTAPADEAEGLAIRRRSIARSRRAAPGGVPAFPWAPRSEEHTSELQSLMRISYAVF